MYTVNHFTHSLFLMPITALPKERINRHVQSIARILLSVEVVVRSGKLYDLVKKAFGFRL